MACGPDPTSCECRQARGVGFCESCPDCGECSSWCGADQHPGCQGDELSCACFAERDSGFCSTCAGAGGPGCGDCDDFCGEERLVVATSDVKLFLAESSACDGAGAASCACFAERDQNFCNACPNCGSCSDWCGGQDHPECETDPDSCECQQARSPEFCGSCPNCGSCSEWCGADDHTACGPDPNSCECRQARDVGFCESCPDCGECSSWCGADQHPGCQGDELSCACYAGRDPGFCSTCVGAGGLGCGDCDDFCGERSAVATSDVKPFLAGSKVQSLCENEPTSCACSADRDPNFCSTCPDCGSCSDWCGFQNHP